MTDQSIENARIARAYEILGDAGVNPALLTQAAQKLRPSIGYDIDENAAILNTDNPYKAKDLNALGNAFKEQNPQFFSPNAAQEQAAPPAPHTDFDLINDNQAQNEYIAEHGHEKFQKDFRKQLDARRNARSEQFRKMGLRV